MIQFLRRPRQMGRLATLVVASLLAVGVASAHAADAGTLIQPGWRVQGGTVTCPGQPARTLSSVQAATFLQSWLPDAFYTKLQIEDPPAGVPRCTVVVPWTVEGQPPQVPMQIGYATNGTRVWVHLPPGKWSVPTQTQRIIDSFAGNGTYVPVPTTPLTTTPPPTTAPIRESHDSGNTWIWIVAAGAIAALGVTAVLRSRRRPVVTERT